MPNESKPAFAYQECKWITEYPACKHGVRLDDDECLL